MKRINLKQVAATDFFLILRTSVKNYVFAVSGQSHQSCCDLWPWKVRNQTAMNG